MPSPRSKYYILVEGQPVPASLTEWAIWLEAADSDRIVAKTQVTSYVEVSTVFLGLDHNFVLNDPAPLIYETMVFGGSLDQEMDRYPTKEQAELGHDQWVARVREAEGLSPESTPLH